jgi:choline dehydrogenase-like flavoprotein
MIVEGPGAAEGLEDRVFDVCIIGAGAAGIAIAKELDGATRSVALLEAGGLEVSAASQRLYSGEEDTQRMPANYLSTQRLRVFGGTTGHWAGEGRPLDEIDFERREWIPHSGWPIARRDLEPFYGRASAYCGLPGIQPDDVSSSPQTGDAAEPAEPAFSFRPLYNASPVPRFGTEHLAALRASRNVHVFLTCPVVKLDARAGGRGVSAVTVSLGGRDATVKAQVFVLAAGTIENARLLLHAARLGTLRLGPETDVVGRYVMDHSEGTCALLRLPQPEMQSLGALTSSFDQRARARYSPTLWLSPRIQAAKRLPNVAFQVTPLRADEHPDQLEGIGHLVDYFRSGRGTAGVSFSVTFRGETRPNPENRVSLTDTLDELGVPRVKLFYRWSASDLQAFDEALGLLAQDIGLRHGAVVRQTDASANAVGSSFHQMGTTRMGHSPTDSVVDRNCRVHSVPNLFVGGSSVFPTCGWVNPTLSLVALAVRLADHLKEPS